jgi:hypothetical protein
VTDGDGAMTVMGLYVSSLPIQGSSEVSGPVGLFSQTRSRI